MPAADRRPLKTRNAAWAQALARWLAARGASANGISIAGMGFATLGAAAFTSIPHFGRTAQDGMSIFAALTAAACVQLRLLCNMLDGMVAVEGGRKGRAGDLFNEAPDRYEDIVLLAGAGYACGESSLGWAAAAMAVLTAYIRAFGASLGQGQDFCGPFAKPHRMFFLTLGTLAEVVWAVWGSPTAYPAALETALLFITAGSLFTAARGDE
jgi:phosphatidylglycerophosphate synthase